MKIERNTDLKYFVPDVFVPGVAKCGTSSLHDLLNKHPNICMSTRKEPHFWTDTNFNAFKQENIDAYKSYFDNKTTKIKGESSTGSLFFPELFIPRIKSIAKTSPKFIIILRNPIDRSYSHYWWCKGSGRERRNFRNAIIEDKNASFEAYPDWPKNYYQFSIYSQWIDIFIKEFGKENILFITLESLKTNPLETINSCFKFLNLEPLEIIEPVNNNETVIVKHSGIYNISRKISKGDYKFTKFAKYMLPVAVINKIRYLLNEKVFNLLKTDKKYQPISPEEKQWLKKLYRNEVTTLEKMLNRTFTEWKDFH
ncbi:sulfotransferase [Neptunitalea chrysea]|uniref:Sulfotransferase n=1 Tax=Neptunitalea chrysea TaxID=1647581 RepID=A0A9W6EW36_9FLAO|nr:sulfotransferase domain-containing protein [Neptunitalea chrysea]GLB53736.1 sulfotransferase [Neptunitalea chrysea]